MALQGDDHLMSIGMVAIRKFLPDKPGDRELATTILNAHPELADFIVRFSGRVLESWNDVEITLDARQYDERDPPLTILVTESMQGDEYIDRFGKIYDLARNTPGYHRDLVHISLRSHSLPEHSSQ